MTNRALKLVNNISEEETSLPPNHHLSQGPGLTLLMEPLMTAPEVAAVLRRPVRHVYRLARRRELVPFRDGRRVHFRRADVEQYIKDHCLLPTEQHRQLREKTEKVRLTLLSGSGSRTRR